MTKEIYGKSPILEYDLLIAKLKNLIEQQRIMIDRLMFPPMILKECCLSEERDLIDLYAFRQIMKHLTSITSGKRPEDRKREQRRCKLAIRRITKWQADGQKKLRVENENGFTS